MNACVVEVAHCVVLRVPELLFPAGEIGNRVTLVDGAAGAYRPASV